MNNTPLRIVLTFFIIGAIVLGLACATGTNQNVSNSDPVAKGYAGACELELDQAERDKLQADLEAAIRDKGVSKKLKKSLDGDGTYPSWMNFEVRQAPPGPNEPNRYYEVIFYGAVGGNGQFEELTDVLNDFDDKKECLRRGIFLPAGAARLAPDQRADGFEWVACDYPNRPCSDGSCGC